MDRREALRKLATLAGVVISAPAAAGLFSARASAQTGVAGRSFSASQLELAGALAERILPRTESPGALDAGVHHFLDGIVAEYLSEADRSVYLAGLEQIDALARVRFGAAFTECPVERQDRLLAELEQATFETEPEAGASYPTHFYRLHKQLTVLGYFTSEIGETSALRRVPYGDFEPDIPIDPDDSAFA